MSKQYLCSKFKKKKVISTSTSTSFSVSSEFSLCWSSLTGWHSKSRGPSHLYWGGFSLLFVLNFSAL